MSEMQSYLKEKLHEFNSKYNVKYKLSTCWDKELKRQWKRDCEEISAQWQEVNSVADIQKYVDWYAATVERYENIRGFYTDAYDMDLALYRAISAIQKMAQCYDMDRFDFHTFGKAEIDTLFEKLYETLKAMQDVNLRRAMQD